MTKPEPESAENLSLIAAIHRHAIEKPEQCALIFLRARGEEQTVATFAEVYADLRCAAWGWYQLGVEPGSVVLLALDHSYELVIAFLGALYAGAVPVILPYPRIKGLNSCAEQIQLLAEFTGAAAVSTTASVAELLQSQPEVLKFGLHAFNLAQAEMPPADFCAYQRGNEQVLYLQLTSGTTGTPKLAMLSQKAVMTNIRRVFETRYQSGGTVAGCMPFNHDGGLVLCLLIPLVMGRLSVQLSPSHWIARPDVFWDAVAAYRVAITFLPNFALGFMTRRIEHCQPARYNLSSLHTVIVAAELVTHNSLDSFYHHFCGCGLKEEALCAGYGMAEQVVGVSLGPVGSLARIDWVAQERLQAEGVAQPAATGSDEARAVVSCGHPLAGLQVTIVADDRRPLPERTVGEVLVRSEHCFNGYFNRPDLTAPIMHGDWHCTGDLGYLAEGELFILGRKDDLIIVAGENIQPQAIEEIALTVLGARGRLAVAFGVRDEQLGTQRPVLVCETRHNEPAEQLAAWRAEILNQVQNRLNVTLTDLRFAGKGWVIQSDAKIARAACHQKYLAEFTPVCLEANVQTVTIRAPRPQLDTPFIAPRTELEQQLASIWAELLGLDEVGVNDNFFQLGGDSLTALRMTLAMEETTGRRVPPEFFRTATVAHLAGLLAGDAMPVTTEQLSAPQTAPAQPASKPQPRSWSQRARVLPHKVRFLARSAIEAQAFHRPYFEGIQWLLRWQGRLGVQRVFYPGESRLVRYFAASMGAPQVQIDREVALNLAGTTVLRRWTAETGHHALPGQAKSAIIAELDEALRSKPDSPLWHQYISVEGTAYLDRAVADGRGAILVSFHSPTRYAPQMYFAPFAAAMVHVSRQAYLAAAKQIHIPEAGISEGRTLWTAARAAVTRAAYDALREGGLVTIAGDEQNAENGVLSVIGDRFHRLSPGFAELAAVTGAAALPFYSALRTDGRIQITIAPPLVWDDRRSRSEQVVAIVQAYACVQTAIWRQTPSAVSKEIMAQHLALPPKDKGGKL